jgi:hypothetical protein
MTELMAPHKLRMSCRRRRHTSACRKQSGGRGARRTRTRLARVASRHSSAAAARPVLGRLEAQRLSGTRIAQHGRSTGRRLVERCECRRSPVHAGGRWRPVGQLRGRAQLGEGNGWRGSLEQRLQGYLLLLRWLREAGRRRHSSHLNINVMQYRYR